MSDLTPLQRLHRVQELDLSLDRLQDEEGNIPPDLRTARDNLEQINNDLESTEISLEEVDKQVRQAELDLSSLQEQIAKATDEQEKNAYDARAQSQYGSRIQQLQERAEDLQEDMQPLKERQKDLSEKASKLRGEHKSSRPVVSDLEQKDEQRISDLRNQGESARQERASIVPLIDSRTIKEYDQIRKAKKGQGISEVISGRCSACNVVLPVNAQQKIAQNKLPPVKCPSCGRFLIRLD